jgi:hypothetical protein
MERDRETPDKVQSAHSGAGLNWRPFSKSHKPALLILTFQANSGIIRTQLNH